MKRVKSRLILLCLVVFFIEGPGWTQQQMTLYHFDQVPQHSYLNPSFIPRQGSYIGIPLLSDIYLAYANPFSYSDIFTSDVHDSLNFEVENFLVKISENNRLRFHTNLNLISFGFGIAKKRFFLDFGIREKISQHVRLPENLFNLLWYGNGSPQLLGHSVNIAPEINTVVYDEFGVGISGSFLKNRLSLGVRLKYLSGRLNVNTLKSELNFYTDSATYNILMNSDFEIQTSGVDQIERYLDRPIHSLIFPENNGFSFDIGINLEISRHFVLSASVLDVGFIKWKTQTLTFVSKEPGADFKFHGFNMKDFVSMFDDMKKFGDKIADSLFDLVQIDSVVGVKYTTRLPVMLNFGASFLISNNHRLNLLACGELWKSYLSAGFSFSYNYSLKDIFGFIFSYNLFNKQYLNIGCGISLTARPVQLYIVTDNFPALFLYQHSKNFSIQLGINIIPNRQ